MFHLLVLVLCFGGGLATASTAETLAYPIDKTYVSGSYANRVFFAGQDHLGEDIDLIEETVVKAIGNGKIMAYRSADGYGELVAVIEHDLGREYAFINAYGKIVVTRKILSIYGHIRDRKKRDDGVGLHWKVGDDIKKSDVIGYVNKSSHPDGQSPDPNGDGLEHLHLGIRLQSQSAAQAADSQGWFRGYEKSTDQGKYFASADAVIQIVLDKGIQELCARHSVSSGAAICWTPSSPSDVQCTQAKSWTVYYSYTNMVRVNTKAYCTTADSVFAHYGGGMPTGPLGGGGTNIVFNLNINHFWVRDTATQFDLVAGGHTIRTGQTLEIRNQVKAVNGDTHDFMRPGKNRIEVDFWVREDDGDWHFLGREYIQATNLSSGTTHTEHIAYTVPPDVSQASFKVKIDAEDEAYEVNEGDNWSKVTTFTVDNNPSINLIVSVIQLVNTPIPVPPGSGLRAKMALKNIGTTAPSVGIRSSYSYRPLGSVGPWTQIADDGSDPEDLVPNQEHWEEILSAVTVPTIPGGYELRVCVDYQHAVSESNENDNCLVTIFQVGSLPNLVVTYIGIDSWPDTSIQKGKTHYPTMKVRNSGTGLVSVTTRQRYYLSGPATGNVWQEIDGDDTEAGRLCAGCETTESIKKGFTINKKGIHSLKACADSDNRQPELDETDNCLVSAPIMVK